MANRFRLTDKSAFTLIELIIVIIIIGVIISIAPVIIVRYLSNQDIENASLRLVSSLERLQMSDASANPATIYINMSAGCYTIYSNTSGETVYLPKNIYFLQAPSQITFNEKGLSASPAGDTIILTNLNKKISIAIKKLTGEIEMKKN